MKTNLPLDIRISFHKIIEIYQEQIEREPHEIHRNSISQMLDFLKHHPELIKEFKEPGELEDFREPVNTLLKSLFPSFLSNTEIKAVSVPFHDFVFSTSQKFKCILANAGTNFELKLEDYEPAQEYIRACILILNSYYGYEIEYARPMYYEIPDLEGMPRQYRLDHDAVFGNIEPTGASRDISDKDVDYLIQHTNDLEIWREYFPPQSWIFTGFSVKTLVDVTEAEAISHLKSTLLSRSTSYIEDLQRLEEVFKSIYRIADLKMGFSYYNKGEERFERLEGGVSYLLGEEFMASAEEIFNEETYKLMMEENEVFISTNCQTFFKKQTLDRHKLVENLMKAEAGSVILAPIARHNRLLGVLELISPRKNELNSINAFRLEDIIPYMFSAIERSVAEHENRVKAVIQSQCTSIHPSVLWVFEREARRFIKEQDADGMATFGEIVFNNVHPLYGQIDIVSSSEVRNKTIQDDLLRQLHELKDLMWEMRSIEKVDLHKQIKRRLDSYIVDLKKDLDASSEQKVVHFFDKEINPMLDQMVKENPHLKSRIKNYFKMLNPDTGLIYERRRAYDESVQQVNQSMARYLDQQQREAQNIFPHYFERYKTDGVDHNLYIGASLSNLKEKPFVEAYLHELRLWQLRTMCEMEYRFKQLQKNLPLHLEVASLILVFNSTLSIRYRLDEKRFDVDGTYNARYEIIKKRIDKACIKDTDERVVQQGKIVIIYSLQKDEQDYLRYIKYLQSHGYLGEEVELLELDEVQGVAGLKAIRVEVLYTLGDTSTPLNLTYHDLVEKGF